ncbi:hypothetical protein [Sinisalibacter aestuarii]|uniref:Rhamnan synthesis protein F n=1 Tax=Sinisalibacter aestuarii TaxID=2949426 RepID=A0ABQ5LW88_9RHOB|nr:hypothetical protein [Sinisalibacter aestuarii]GKY88630.1 hypothetical protein STA1M1_24990 [Sinisalibacter aestuarii]
MKIISRIQSALLYPMARAIVGAQSQRARLRSWGKAPRLHHEAPYEGQPILLLALYQKGRLRPDLIRLIAAARAQGLYVLAVNTLKVTAPDALAGLVDCYIERPNFGRDFGSYKTGFLHLYQRGWEARCPRLVMVNDSVYYSTRGLAAFIEDLATCETEVLGATENYEIEYHLGSFCISMAGGILQSGRLRRYWRRYRLTDVRPLVIKRGELGLSKTLKRCASSEDDFASLFSAARFLSAISADDQFMAFAMNNITTSRFNSARRPLFASIARTFKDRYGVQTLAAEDLPKNSEMTLDSALYDVSYVSDLDQLRAHFTRFLKTGDVQAGDLRTIAIAELGDRFLFGSHIHHNAAALLWLGVPFIKNDGLYRGAFSVEDVTRIGALLPPGEAREFMKLLLSRPYGGSTLRGWKLAAFAAGLI